MSTTKLFRALLLLAMLALPTWLGSAAIKSSSQTCPSSGVKQLSTTNTPANWILVQSPSDNTGVVAVGGSTVTAVAACAAAVGNCLTVGGSYLMPPASNTAAYNLSQTWFACTVSGDKVMFNYLQ